MSLDRIIQALADTLGALLLWALGIGILIGLTIWGIVALIRWVTS